MRPTTWLPQAFPWTPWVRWMCAGAMDIAARMSPAGCARMPTMRHPEASAIPTFDYTSVMSADRVLLDWLLAARDVGLTMLTGMPATDEAIELVARRISFIRESNFGVTFEVRTKVEAVDSNAYTSLPLPAHTDLPTRELQPGLQFLHCLINDATGGESTFVDGFAIAAALRADSPGDFRLLCEHPVEFWNKSPQSDYRSFAPVIGLDARGEVSEIRLANWLRAPFNLPAAEMGAFYRAYRHFCALTRDSRFIVSRRLEAGQMWCFEIKLAESASCEGVIWIETNCFRAFSYCNGVIRKRLWLDSSGAARSAPLKAPRPPVRPRGRAGLGWGCCNAACAAVACARG